MAFILRKTPSYGTLVGNALGQGLEALAQNKLQQIQQRNLSQKLQEGFGFNPQEAEAFSQLSPDLQKLAFKQKITAPSQQLFAQALGQLQGTGGEQLALPEGAGLTEKQALDLAKFGQKERQLENVHQRETREFLAPYEQAFSKRQKEIQRNRELKELAKSGNIRAGTTQAILDKLGLGSFFQNVDTQLAQKNLAAQAQSAGSAFNTSRLTNLDVNLYKQSLGTLWNTPQGLYAVASVNNLAHKAENAKQKARREIIKENKGKIPYNIEELTEQKAEPELKKLADKSMALVTSGASKFYKNKDNGFSTINDARKYIKPGQKIYDNKTGKYYDWQGKEVKG